MLRVTVTDDGPIVPNKGQLETNNLLFDGGINRCPCIADCTSLRVTNADFIGV